MSEKNESSAATQSGSSRSGSGAASGSATARAGSGMSNPPGKVVGARQKQFIIAPRWMSGMMQPMGLQPMALDYVEQALRAGPEVEIVDRIGPTGLVGTLADSMGGSTRVLVAKMADDKAELLKQQSVGHLIVEQDQPLSLELSETHEPGLVAAAVVTTNTTQVAIMVLGKDNTPIKDAEVHLFGGLMPATGVTDERGVATIQVFGDPEESVTAMYVKPKFDYWTGYQVRPSLDSSQTNLVYLRPLADSFQGFPRKQAIGWGQKVMRLEQVPNGYRGQGVRVAIVDSGAASSHPNLQSLRLGLDITDKKSDPGGWNQDPVAHGSHCAGVIAGADNGQGIRGFAPDAEVHVCKQFPGGRMSHLIEALEYCIEKQIDVVNLSLSGEMPSEALEQQILRAKRLGVACIAAAGNTAGPVHYPASSPNVLAVAAVGKIGEFPMDSYHAQTVGPMDVSGFFSPRFTCYGPEIAVCAPGVAILSTVPPSNYAVWDGTSSAASHVTGLAALVLAHHPDFQGPFKARTADRVDRLFQILRASAQPLNLGDVRRTGYGIPDVLVALGLAPQTQPMWANRAMWAAQHLPLFSHPMSFGQPVNRYTMPYQQVQVPVGAW